MFGLWDDRGLDCGIINLVTLNRRLDHRFLGTADDEDAVVDLPESIGNIALGIAAFNTGEDRFWTFTEMCGFVAAVDLNRFYGIRIVKIFGAECLFDHRAAARNVVNERSSQREIQKKLIKLGIFTRKLTTVGKAARVDEHDLIKQFWRVAARHDRQCR